MSDTSHRTYWQGGTGTWSNGTYWSNGVASTGLNGTIGVVDPFAADFTVTLPTGGAYGVTSLLLDDSGATLINDGTLGSTAGITIGAGTLIDNGVLTGTVALRSGGNLIETGQTIVALNGSLALQGGNLEVGDTGAVGVVLTNAVGSDFVAAGTITPVYKMGTHGYGTPISQLTLENAGTLAVENGYTPAGLGFVSDLILGAGTLDNTGLVTATNAYLDINDFALNNAAGATIAGYGARVNLAASIDNAGLITVTGGTLQLAGAYTGATFVNTGTIAATNALLELGGDPTVADLAGITLTNSSLMVVGSIENAGNMLGAGAGILQGATIGNNVYQTGTIVGGTVDVAAAGLDLAHADFVGVTLVDGLTLSTGAVTLSGGTVQGGVTVDGGTLTLDQAAGSDVTQAVDLIQGAEVIDGSFTLTAPLSVGVGAYLALGSYTGGSWTNRSTITIGAGGTLALHGDETAADLGAIVNQGGTILLSGTIENTGQTLGLAGSDLTGATLQGGTIIGGAVMSDGLTLAGGEIDGGTILGGLTLAPLPGSSFGSFTELTLANGAVVDQASGVLGTVSLDAEGSNLTVEGTGAVGQPFVVTAGNLDLNGNLTLTAPIVLDGSLASAAIDSYGTALSQVWTNASTLTVENGAQLTLGGSVTSGDFGIIVDQGGNVSFDGTLVNGSGVLNQASTGLSAFTLANGGTIIGGTIAQSASFTFFNGYDTNYAAGTAALSGINALDGVTMRGGLDVTTGTLALINGGAVLNAAGTGPEAVTVSSFATLIDLVAAGSLSLGGFDLAGGTLEAANTAGSGLMLDNAAGSDFTLGGVIADLAGGSAHPVTVTNEGSMVVGQAGSFNFFQETIAVDSLVNTGMISVTGTGLAIASALTNRGTIAGSATGITLAQGFDNQGLITVSGGSLVLGGSDAMPGAPGSNVLQSWSNTGVIAATGAVVTLGGDVALAAIGSLSLTTSSLVLDGHIENFGQTLASSGAGTLLAGATLAGAVFVGGAVDFGGFDFDVQNAVIDNATIIDGLTLATGAVTLINGSQVLAPGGASLATVLVDGAGADFGIDLARPGTIAQPIEVTTGTASITGAFTLTGALDATGTASTIALLGGVGGYGAGARSWINAGTVSLSSGASLLLGGAENAADIGTIANQGGVLAFVAGTFDNAGQTLGIGDPSLIGMTLAGGTIAGGAIDVAAESFAVAGDALSANAALDNVVVQGALTVGTEINLTLEGTTAVYAGTTGTAPGAITIGSTGLVDFDTSATPTLVNDVTLEGGNLSWSAPPPAGTTMETAVNAVIAAGVEITGDGRLFTTVASGETLTNLGTIDATKSFGSYYLGIYGSSFTNQGIVNVGTGGALKVDATDGVNLATIAGTGAADIGLMGASFSNQGDVAANGAALRIGGSFTSTTGTTGYTAFSNAGTISDTGGTVLLDADITTSGLGAFNDGSSSLALIGGTLDNAGATLGAGSADFKGLIMTGGTIAGGVLDPAGVGITFAGDTPYGGFDPVLDNVDVTGGLTIGTYASLTIAGSTSIFASATSTAPGSIVVDHNGAIVFDQSLTPVLTNAVTLDGGALDFSGALNSFGAEPSIAATLAAGAIVSGYGTVLGGGATQSLTNLGGIVATAGTTAGPGLTIEGMSLTNDNMISAAASASLDLASTIGVNQGTITAADGAGVTLGGQSFTNAAGGTIAGSSFALEIGQAFYGFNPVTGAELTGHTSFVNAGTISDTDGTVLLNGDIATGGLGAFTDTGSTIALIGGTLDNTGATLGANSTDFHDLVMTNGTILGGVLDPGGLGLTIAENYSFGNTPELDNVDVTGPLTVGPVTDLTIAGSTAIFASGTGATPGSIMVGQLGAIVFDQSLAPVLTNAVTLNGGYLEFGDPAAVTYGNTVTIAATIGSGAMVSGSGSILAPSYGTVLDLTNLGTIATTPTQGGFYSFTDISGQSFTNEGQISVAADTVLEVFSTFSNAGTVAISGGSVEFMSVVTGPGIIDFTTTGGNLTLGVAQNLPDPVIDFAVGDTIVVDNFTAATTAVTYVAGTGLELGNGTTVLTLAIDGNYTTGDFTVTDNYAGTEITLAQNPPCFAAGTRILTTAGEMPVEALTCGDRVILHGGGSAPIRWIGHRRVNLARHPHPETVLPILIEAGAILDGVPKRDLYVSPDHAIALAGHLIPAKVLLNGHTIRQVARRSVTYYHVELPAHAVLYAEATPTESYLETGNRGAFENGGTAVTLHPDFAQSRREQTGCAPFAEAGPVVETVRAAILVRAGIATTDNPALTVTCRRDGSMVIRSRNAIPGLLTPDPRDRRRLGIKIAAIRRADGTTIPLDHPMLTEGWHAPEPDGRWTNGDAVIPSTLIGRTGALQIEPAATLAYPQRKTRRLSARRSREVAWG
ncbi:Hint domain-containing protein [Acidiphilium sp.]|uniref:Hint domain-containing protein n=1 Tax=Acidiphilium sp. TaxID=527 RepID=UPI003D01E2F8